MICRRAVGQGTHHENGNLCSHSENGDLWTEIAIRAISLPKVVNKIVNWGVQIVNRTAKSCESPFPPTKKLWITGKVGLWELAKCVRAWLCFGEAISLFMVHSWSSNRHQFTGPHLRLGRPQWDSHGPGHWEIMTQCWILVVGHRTQWPSLGSRNSAQPSLFCHFLHFYLFPCSKILQVDTIGSCIMFYQFRTSMAAGGMEDLSNVVQGQMCTITWPLQLFSSSLPALQVEWQRKKSENI